MARIYLASSWQNEEQPAMVALLRGWGHEVYDFRNPPHRDGGFAWSDIDGGWKDWSAEGFREALLSDPVASHGYLADARAMEWADTFVLLLPCGRSAHLELGWAAGRGKRTVVVLADGCEPELMYLMVNHLVVTLAELAEALPVAMEYGYMPGSSGTIADTARTPKPGESRWMPPLRHPAD